MLCSARVDFARVDFARGTSQHRPQSGLCFSRGFSLCFIEVPALFTQLTATSEQAAFFSPRVDFARVDFARVDFARVDFARGTAQTPERAVLLWFRLSLRCLPCLLQLTPTCTATSTANCTSPRGTSQHRPQSGLCSFRAHFTCSTDPRAGCGCTVHFTYLVCCSSHRKHRPQSGLCRAR